MTSPRCCGIFNRPVVFTALLSFAVFNYFGVQGPYTTGILTTLQREFKFKSSEVGFLLTVNDIVGLIVVTPLAYLGAKSHRPRIIGILMVIFSIGCFVSAIPQFVGGGDDGLKNDTDPMLMKEPQVFLCEDDVVDDDDTCSAAEEAASGAQYSRAIWLFLGQALCGIGGAGFFPLGITYIDDGVPKSSSSVHVGKCFIWLPWLHSLTRSPRPGGSTTIYVSSTAAPRSISSLLFTSSLDQTI